MALHRIRSVPLDSNSKIKYLTETQHFDTKSRIFGVFLWRQLIELMTTPKASESS
jgi:hypothetical protein